jgi:hypothetical protein
LQNILSHCLCTCAGVDPDLPAVIEKKSGLSWCCINLKFESFKTEFLKLAEENVYNAPKNFTRQNKIIHLKRRDEREEHERKKLLFLDLLGVL